MIDAVGMEAHGSPLAKLGHKVVGLMPDRVAEKLMTRAGTDRLAAHRRRSKSSVVAGSSR